MSKILYVQFRNQTDCNPANKNKIRHIVQRINADNIVPRPETVFMEENTIYGISNPSSFIKMKGKSVLLGLAFEDGQDWWEPGGYVPDGSFSLFRTNDNHTEIVSDAAASRTVWYYHDQNLFAASSSQRAIVALIGDFELNRKVIPWMFSTGSLGPSLSWDSRINALPPDSVAVLEHQSWTLGLKSNEIAFQPENVPDKEHEARLLDALRDTFRSMPVDLEKVVLPLSGGYDSRGILCLLNSLGLNIKRLKAVTWGLASAVRKPGNDAFIAKKVAEHFKIRHKYYPTDISEESFEKIFERFLLCGEGRVDHIGGYMDGFKLWADLFNDDIQGIMRGDEGFGLMKVFSADNVRLKLSLSLCSDIPNLANYEELGLPKQEIPANLQKREDESLETWRDRLYHQHRLPVLLSALTDLKLPFTEVINPLLSRRILLQTRKLPDRLRKDKNLYRKIIQSISPAIAYATSNAPAPAHFVVRSEKSVKIIRSELTSERCRSIIPETLINYTLENYRATKDKTSTKTNIKALIKLYVPAKLLEIMAGEAVHRDISAHSLAFRIFMISRMNHILEQDAEFFREYYPMEVEK